MLIFLVVCMFFDVSINQYYGMPYHISIMTGSTILRPENNSVDCFFPLNNFRVVSHFKFLILLLEPTNKYENDEILFQTNEKLWNKE